jgi:hypothetical protein
MHDRITLRHDRPGRWTVLLDGQPTGLFVVRIRAVQLGGPRWEWVLHNDGDSFIDSVTHGGVQAVIPLAERHLGIV